MIIELNRVMSDVIWIETHCFIFSIEFKKMLQFKMVLKSYSWAIQLEACGPHPAHR